MTEPLVLPDVQGRPDQRGIPLDRVGVTGLYYPLTIREKEHQANRGQLYGKTVKDPKYPFAIMKPVTYVDPSKFMD